MTAAPLPLDEAARMRRLLRLGVLDTSRDGVMDSIAQRALLVFPGADSAAISFVGPDRVWFKASAGRHWSKLPRGQAFCSHAVLGRSLFVVEDSWRDPRFTDNPLVVGEPGIRFYAGAPLQDGVGVLCVIGLQPRSVSKIEAESLALLAHAVEQRLALHRAVHELTRQIPLG